MFNEQGGSRPMIPRPNMPNPVDTSLGKPQGQMPRPNNPMAGQKFTVPPPPPQGGHPVRRLRMWQQAQKQSQAPAGAPVADRPPRWMANQANHTGAGGAARPHGSGPFVPTPNTPVTHASAGGVSQPAPKPRGIAVGEPIGISLPNDPAEGQVA